MTGLVHLLMIHAPPRYHALMILSRHYFAFMLIADFSNQPTQELPELGIGKNVTQTYPISYGFLIDICIIIIIFCSFKIFNRLMLRRYDQGKASQIILEIIFIMILKGFRYLELN